MPRLPDTEWRCIERVSCSSHERRLDVAAAGWRRRESSVTVEQTDFFCRRCSYDPFVADTLWAWEALNDLPALVEPHAPPLVGPRIVATQGHALSAGEFQV